jgi:hypothetical protein
VPACQADCTSNNYLTLRRPSAVFACNISQSPVQASKPGQWLRRSNCRVKQAPDAPVARTASCCLVAVTYSTHLLAVWILAQSQDEGQHSWQPHSPPEGSMQQLKSATAPVMPSHGCPTRNVLQHLMPQEHAPASRLREQHLTLVMWGSWSSSMATMIVH